jgi:hypothetical protein
MADQAGSGQGGGRPGEGAVLGPATGGQLSAAVAGGPAHQAFHGRAVSWTAVTTIMSGFLAGGIGLVAGPAWWAFWAGAALAALGGLLALATNIFEDWY